MRVRRLRQPAEVSPGNHSSLRRECTQNRRITRTHRQCRAAPLAGDQSLHLTGLHRGCEQHVWNGVHRENPISRDAGVGVRDSLTSAVCRCRSQPDAGTATLILSVSGSFLRGSGHGKHRNGEARVSCVPGNQILPGLQRDGGGAAGFDGSGRPGHNGSLPDLPRIMRLSVLPGNRNQPSDSSGFRAVWREDLLSVAPGGRASTPRPRPEVRNAQSNSAGNRRR